MPVGRPVDWVDQSLLAIVPIPVADRGTQKQLAKQRSANLEPSLDSRCGVQTRTALRRIGIRTATDLRKAIPEPDKPSAGLSAAGADIDQLRILATVLQKEEGLRPVWHWQQRGVPR